MIKFKIFPKNVVAILSEKRDGSMKLKAGFEQKHNDLNRSGFFKKIKVPEEDAVSVHLIHGKKIAVVNENNLGDRIDGVDALITKSKNVFLSVTVADCLPVFIYDPENEIAAMVHAGWRGLNKRIIPATIKKMVNMGSSPVNILAAVGPGIGPCHFEVSQKVANVFSIYKGSVQKKQGKIYVDLKSVAKSQLIGSGLLKKNIEINESCTFDNRAKFFSYRRDRPKMIQAMAAIMGMRSAKDRDKDA